MKKLLTCILATFMLLCTSPTKVLAEDNLTEEDLYNRIELIVDDYLKKHNVKEIYELNDLDTNILLDMIENEKNKFYGDKKFVNISSNFARRAEAIRPLADYSGGIFVHMDSATSSWNHGHAAIGYYVGTIEIRGPHHTVSHYGESRLIEWYNANTGGYYTVRGVTKQQCDSAAARAHDFIGSGYAPSGLTCVMVVTRAWSQGGKVELPAIIPSDFPLIPKLVRQFKWTDVKYQ